MDFGGVAPGTVNVEMQLRRGTSADWTYYDPTLAEGEIGLATDTKLFKIGDGIHVWSDLPYGGLNGPFSFQSIPPNSATNSMVSYDNVNCQLTLSSVYTLAQVSPVSGSGYTWAWSGTANINGQAAVSFTRPNNTCSAGTWYDAITVSQQLSNSGDSATVYLQDSNANKAYQIVFMANGTGGGAINILRLA